MLDHSVDTRRKSEIDARIARLSPAKRAALMAQLQAPVGDDAIPARADACPVPLSYAQQRMWFLQRLRPDGVEYNGVRAFRLRGPLDRTALATALDALAQRHESLRTTVAEARGEPTQRIAVAAGARFPLELIDDIASAPARRAQRLGDLADAAVRRPIDLERGPLARAALVRFADDDHGLLLAFHHAVADRWSTAILERELGAAYVRAGGGDVPADPPLPVGYGDVAVWERRRLAGGELDASIAYWRTRLAAAPSPPPLPSDRLAASTDAHPSAEYTRAVPAELGSALRAFCRERGVTPFMALLATFSVLINRYTGCEDVLVGCPIAGRSRLDTQGLVGMFVNTLVLRTDLSGDPSFAAATARVRERALEAFEHQEVPFEKVVEVVQPERRPGATPFFRTMFAVQNAPPRVLAIPGLDIDEFDVRAGEAKFELTLMVEQAADGGFTCAYEYDASLFDRAAVARLSGHYESLLASALRDPELAIADLTLVPDAERETLVHAWNDPARPAAGVSVGALFERQAAAAPDRIALRFEGRAVTYAELDTRAGSLAHRLRAAGVRPGVNAGVYADRSVEMIVAIVAIVKAGGAYVPLDPDNPPARTAFIAADAGAHVILTRAPLLHALAACGTTAPVVCVDAAEPDDGGRPSAADGGGAHAEDIVCLLYTSGSTGEPKGVEVPHRAVPRLVCETNYIRFAPDDVVLQSGNFAFDISTFEIWGALLHGATLLICEKNLILEPDTYAAVLRDEGVTITFLTPVVFNEMARRIPAAFGGLRALLVGGEALDPDSARRVLESGAPPAHLINGYGPTEVTTLALTHDVRAVAPGVPRVPIGRPIANTTAYVTDARGRLVPLGVTGELLLGGPGVARGYRNRPQLTAQAFVDDDFAREPGGRLYRTGDAVRRLADGTVDFIGRVDGQLKMRGFRIEIGEIESALAAHPAVGAAAVVRHRPELRGDGSAADSSDDELVAYVVPSAADRGAQIDLDALRASLAGRLPAYMVPASYVQLDGLPVTANGKLDRAALPRPPAAARSARSQFVAPGDVVEQRLAAIWESLLGTTGIGSRDDFFALGGHSLLAVRMLHRVENELGARLPVRILFEHPTVAGLARAIATGQTDVTTRRYVCLNPSGTRPPFILLHGFFDGGLYTLNLAQQLRPDRPFFALHPHSQDGAREPLPPTIEAMADDHVRAIRAFAPHGPYYLGGFCNGARIAYEIALRLRAAGESVPLLAIFTTPPPNPAVRLRQLVATAGKLRGRDRGLEADLRTYALWQERLLLLRSPRLLKRRLAWRLAGSPPEPEAKLVLGVAEDAERRLAYLDRISWYAPRATFDGHVALIWGRNTLPAYPDPVRLWKRWARSVSLALVSGGTASSLTDHPDEIGPALDAAMRRADEAAPSCEPVDYRLEPVSSGRMEPC